MAKRSAQDATRGKNLTRPNRDNETPLRRTVRAILFALALWLIWSAAFIFYAVPARLTVTLREPAPRDIKAPRQVVYESEVKTREARTAAAAQVREVYTPPDMGIANKQLRTLHEIAAQITALRQDQESAYDQKLKLLDQIPALGASPGLSARILELDDASWQTVITETARVLELTLRDEVRPDQLTEARQRVRRLIFYALPDNLQPIVVNLAQGLVVPNSFQDTEQTNAQRNAASSAVKPVQWTIREGESIVREGEIVTELALEKLRVLGLLTPRRRWQEVGGTLVFFLVIVGVLSLYVAKSQPLLVFRPRRELLLLLTLASVGVAVRVGIPAYPLMAYLFPAAAVSMMLAALLNVQLATAVSAIVAILIALNAHAPLEALVYALVGGGIGALALGDTDHLGTFARAGVYVALTNVAVIAAFRLWGHAPYDTTSLLQLLAAGISNGLLSSGLSLAAIAFIGKLFGLATVFQLFDLARPTHPLFRQLLIKAPGTYHHSIIVSNLAERAAEMVGADALLARVGSYYHDVGKLSRPYFFTENQIDIENPHDKLDPQTSTDIIIAHIADGLELAHKHSVPERIRDFIAEHHGTTLAGFFYRRAKQENGEQSVSEQDFRYPGPKPQSRETAIVMLADSVEACVRSKRPTTQANLERIVHQMINDRLIGGELDECDLTLKDLDLIREAFISVLQGVFHPRIQYPENVALRESASAPTASSEARGTP